MTYKIKRGKHWGWPLRFGLWYGKKSITRKVVFYPCCRYRQPLPEDYKDTNKLFGVGYLWDHQIDSARFGWYYSDEFQKIVLVAYTYVSGVREQIDLAFCKVAYPYELALIIEDGLYKFRVYDKSLPVNTDAEDPFNIGKLDVPFTHKKKWSYSTNVYFGGNNPAPHDMKISISKI